MIRKEATDQKGRHLRLGDSMFGLFTCVIHLDIPLGRRPRIVLTECERIHIVMSAKVQKSACCIRFDWLWRLLVFFPIFFSAWAKSYLSQQSIFLHIASLTTSMSQSQGSYQKRIIDRINPDATYNDDGTMVSPLGLSWTFDDRIDLSIRQSHLSSPVDHLPSYVCRRIRGWTMAMS